MCRYMRERVYVLGKRELLQKLEMIERRRENINNVVVPVRAHVCVYTGRGEKRNGDACAT